MSESDGIAMSRKDIFRVVRPTPVLAVLLSTTAISPVYAGCDTTDSDTVLTCTGDVTTIQMDYGSDPSSVPDIENVVEIDISDLTSDMTDAEGNAAFIGITASEKVGPDQINITLDNGYGLKSNAGILQQIIVSPDGTEPDEKEGYGNQKGTVGGAGTSAAALNVVINGDDGAALSSETDSGINIQMTAGSGGQGGEGHSTGGTDDGTGGDGGEAGAGQKIYVDIKPDVVLTIDTTNGDPGIYIMSAGGTGGKGGTGRSNGFTSGYGGTGADGGDGGEIVLYATNSDNAITVKDNHGIALISQAGDGGQGGKSIASYNYPGAGGNGGNGGEVYLDYHGKITVTGDSSSAIYVQSVSGAAGVEGDISGGDVTKHAASPSNPGTAGAAKVYVTDGTLSTDGDSSTGIMAQSVGGHGGNGPNSDGIAAYGASGTSGGNGGEVIVSLTDTTVTTKGESSVGVVASSVGGGGGTGGNANGLTAIGGEGAAGGDAGDAQLTLVNTIITTGGTGSDGVAVHSVGGGGGHSGVSKALISTGGSGGSGGNGAQAELTTQGSSITTTGDMAVGINVNSTGGGGGTAKSSKGLTGLGASGGDGGDGGKVIYTSTVDTTTNTGTAVKTTGDLSDGIVLLSQGHGGGLSGSTNSIGLFNTNNDIGASGSGGGSGGDITFTLSDEDTIWTEGIFSTGLHVASTGGGGGKSGSVTDISVVDLQGSSTSQTLGATGGDGGDGGDITDSTVAGTITTKGDMSVGVYVASIGGGGGSAGNQNTTTVGFIFNNNVGADGGGGGNGGEVSFTSSAAITTHGVISHGIVAASIGGSGGHSSNVQNSSVGYNLGDFSQSSTVGSSGGTGGNGGKVTVTLDSSSVIVTHGHNSQGVIAHSIGSTGGASGSMVDASISTLNLTTAVGSSGGNGGSADDVTVTNQGSITTHAEMSKGINAQSNGGGGGDASTVVNAGVSTLSADVTFGGANGSGGTAGDVTVTNSGAIVTHGSQSTGILALSSGGGGGSGGVAVTGSVGIGSVGVTLGASGGNGGTAGTVTVSLEGTGSVTTHGNLSNAIEAISQGGSGGNGGLAVSSSIDVGVSVIPISGSVSVSLGGDGGTGGKGDDVSVTTDEGTTITTKGYKSAGIWAASIGGQGGNGGMAIAGNINVSETASLNVSVSVGGSGGDGGTSGNIEISNQADITTSGGYGYGIYAQSTGGDGGHGGSSYSAQATVTTGSEFESDIVIGGSGGNGGTSGYIKVDNDGDITTTGGNAHGMYLMTQGGSGGSGGSAVSYLANFGTTKKSVANIKLNSEVGGDGGTGSTSGYIEASNSGAISTQRDTSYGIYAATVGGNGGDGGNAGSYAIGYTWETSTGEKSWIPKKGNPLNINYSVTIGGDGGGGSTSGYVDITNESGGSIETQGIASYGIYATSTGGNGGSGGNGEPNAEGWAADLYDVYEDINSIHEQYEQIKELLEIKEEWQNAYKIFTEWSLDIGGSAGEASTGGDVTVTNDGSITTSGSSATAIYAHSIGGGGGNGGDGTAGLLTSITITGSSSGGGDSGDITITNTGSISTSGEGALGIYAQAVGGGGGTGGDIESTIVHATTDMLQTMGAEIFGDSDGGDGGDGGDITITLASGSTITTTGENAHGVWVQSVGGGGGAQGEYKTEENGNVAGAIGSYGNDGNGGFIDLDIAGDITVSGTGAHGLFAQSASGGGDDSYSGGIRLNVSGKIKASGENARAILVQADGKKNNTANKGTCSDDADMCASTSHITVEAGAEVKTTNASAYETIAFMGGLQKFNKNGSIYSSNLLENSGTISAAKPDSAVVEDDTTTAVAIGTDGTASLRIHNLSGGVISGQISLTGDIDTIESSYRHEFENYAGATFEPGNYVNLGSQGYYTGESGSTISPYGTNVVGTSTFAAASVVENGTYALDMTQFYDSPAGETIVTTDVIAFEIDNGKYAPTVDFAATVVPNWVTAPTETSLMSGDLMIVNGYDDDNFDASDATVASTTTATYSLKESTGYLWLSYSVDFSGAESGTELSTNARKYARYFTDALLAVDADATDAASQDLMSLGADYLNTVSAEDLQRQYDHHTLDEAVVAAASANRAAQRLNTLLQSCPVIDPSAGLDFLHQTECTWVQGVGSKLHQDATGDSPEFDESAWGLAIGSQHEVGPDLFLEFAGQFEALSIDGDNFAQDGNRYSFGMALKKEVGRYTFSSTIAGGIYGLDYDRGYSVSDTAHVASSDIDGRYLGAEIRASAVYLGQDGFYAKPSAALAYTHVWQDGFTESGSGSQNWDISAMDDGWLTFTPMVELGRAFTMQSRSALAFVRAGVTMTLSDPSTTFRGSLVGADASVSDLAGAISTDRYQGDLSAGVEILLRDNLSMSLLARTSLSENSYDYGGTARIELRF